MMSSYHPDMSINIISVFCICVHVCLMMIPGGWDMGFANASSVYVVFIQLLYLLFETYTQSVSPPD